MRCVLSKNIVLLFALTALACGLPCRVNGQASTHALLLPDGVQVVWGLDKAYRQKTPTRERVCINGLWRWQPAGENDKTVPKGGWGYFKVPGCWPGITNYMQKDCQTVFAHPRWERSVNMRGLKQAWYQRIVTVPDDWTGRRICLAAEYLNSAAAVFVDGRKRGVLLFPAGELDLSDVLTPGKHVLSLLVTAMPLKDVMLAYNDSNVDRQVMATVARRGLCGDVFLVGAPPAARIANVKVDPSVRKKKLSVHVTMNGLASGPAHRLRVDITDAGNPIKTFASQPFREKDLSAGVFTITHEWLPEKLWDIHTPQNMYTIKVTLLDAGGQTVDAFWPERFGFRELWIRGRDFYLNGKRIYLSAAAWDNAQVGAALANHEAAKESLRRLKSFGVNYVYTHNYGCEPGSHLSFAEMLRAADEVGMLVGLSQPHCNQYDWRMPSAEKTNRYAQHAAFYVRVAQNHPSVVFYPTSHNATGYADDMNPDLIDGVSEVRTTWSKRNAARALRAEAIIKSLDPSRIVYHHSSGNLGAMHTSNFYTNWVPMQELDDWFAHWAVKGAKPFFTCEYAAPFSWDWAMYRGWYRGKREFGSAKVPWEFCLAEWNAQFYGARAYKISDQEKRNLRWEARKFDAGGTWHRWDYPHRLGSRDFVERDPIFADYITSNWRAFRTWGLSANSSWDYSQYWRPRPDVNRKRKNLPVDWTNLQRPGFSPDYIEDRYERIDLAFDFDDWVPSEAGKALIKNNGPLLAYIAGKKGAFTDKAHNFRPGETVTKQIIVINNSRKTATANCEWKMALPNAVRGGKKVTVATGNQVRIPFQVELPGNLPVGAYTIKMTARFSTGETQTDAFDIHVMAASNAGWAVETMALFDPKGETAALFKAMRLSFQRVGAGVDLGPYDVLVIGKGALTLDGPAPDVSRVRKGLKVILFEQNAEVLEKRLGFRVVTYGFRRVFKRVPDHPLLEGLRAENLTNWRGEATTVPPRLQYDRGSGAPPKISWCGIPVTQVWRAGNRGAVASVLIEKPGRGDFLPVLDGGFSLQYSPLMMYREGSGLMLFCQMDVTGRTEREPAAERLVRNIIQYAATWRSRKPPLKVCYVGEKVGRDHLIRAGVNALSYAEMKLRHDHVIVAGPGCGKTLGKDFDRFAVWLNHGGRLLAVGLDQADAEKCPPFMGYMRKAEHVSAYFDAPGASSPFAGISPAELHNRAPRVVPLFSSMDVWHLFANGVLVDLGGLIVLCQLRPWQFDPRQQNTKRTFRRTSFLLSRLLGNMGVRPSTPLLEHVHMPLDAKSPGKRWLESYYLDEPEEWDYPYRFFRW